ncbi:hypothetical protein [Cryobacterium sp. TMT1-66-1]|uniref:hypothetical protein n=1 Tax=Cryobacterium sp. TMT1-66-1 TaxID=1259242 RepID=UPI001069C46D|nr:hypothetical protein [Cryobacterium sp. TMT1-66-1]TFD04137.1 hypothetical protein E3T29_15905 [Cryobacterium sp. TMT1-66-1]
MTDQTTGGRGPRKVRGDRGAGGEKVTRVRAPVMLAAGFVAGVLITALLSSGIGQGVVGAVASIAKPAATAEAPVEPQGPSAEELAAEAANAALVAAVAASGMTITPAIDGHLAVVTGHASVTCTSYAWVRFNVAGPGIVTVTTDGATVTGEGVASGSQMLSEAGTATASFSAEGGLPVLTWEAGERGGCVLG